MEGKNSKNILLKRKDDPQFVRNPLTGRFIKRTSKKYRQLINDNILNLDNADRSDAVIATGTPDELKLLKSKLAGTKIVGKNKKLEIRNGRLQTVRKNLTRAQTVQQTQENVVSAIKENKGILNNPHLTEKQIDFILAKVIDAKMLGVSLNLDQEIERITRAGAKVKPEVKHKHKSRTRPHRTVGRRFNVLPPPETEVDNTEIESDTDFDTSSESE